MVVNTSWGLLRGVCPLVGKGEYFIVGHCMGFHVFVRLDQILDEMTSGILAQVLFFTNNRVLSSRAPVLRYDQGMGVALAAGLVSVWRGLSGRLVGFPLWVASLCERGSLWRLRG